MIKPEMPRNLNSSRSVVSMEVSPEKSDFNITTPYFPKIELQNEKLPNIFANIVPIAPYEPIINEGKPLKSRINRRKL